MILERGREGMSTHTHNQNQRRRRQCSSQQGYCPVRKEYTRHRHRHRHRQAARPLPAYDSGKGGLSESRASHTPQPWAQSAHHTHGARHGVSSSDSHHEPGAHDFSSLVQEGYSMATQNRGQEYLHAGGLQKLKMLASSSLSLPATAHSFYLC